MWSETGAGWAETGMNGSDGRVEEERNEQRKTQKSQERWAGFFMLPPRSHALILTLADDWCIDTILLSNVDWIIRVRTNVVV